MGFVEFLDLVLDASEGAFLLLNLSVDFIDASLKIVVSVLEEASLIIEGLVLFLHAFKEIGFGDHLVLGLGEVSFGIVEVHLA